jgi:16S rRNA (guanine966-N2)-methyltransferase
MRVIAGTARSLPLKTIETMDTRPTTDRVKETLFNMLNPSLPGCRFLDLFAGSGAIGIEALSRGASHAVFVENSEAAVACIQHNLTFTHLDEKAEIMPGDVLTVIRRLDRLEQPPFDIIFMDPPYRQDWEVRVLQLLAQTRLLDEQTIIIVEAALETDFSWLAQAGYYIRKEKKYKTNKHMWIGKDTL